MGAQALIPALGRAEAADLYEFEASLVPIVTVRAVERDLISKTNKQQTNADVTSVEKIKMQR